MPTLHLLRVFCSEDGSGGNALGVFLDGGEVPPDHRAGRRRRPRPERGRVRRRRRAWRDPHLHSGRGARLRRAPEPSVRRGCSTGIDALRLPAGEVPVRRDGEKVYVGARPEWGPPYELAELGSADEVEALDGPPDGHDLTTAWAWIDEDAGTVRARAFPVRIGIAEDEATGSAATKLCALIGRPIDIRQGRGSRILARPGDGRLRRDRRPQPPRTTCATTRCPERTARRSCAGLDGPRPARRRAARSRPR